MLMNMSAILLILERRLSAFIQDRLGPNRVGPLGLFQPLADIVKLVFKEDLVPEKTDKVLYLLSPLIAFVPGFIAFAVIPFGSSSWGFGGSLAVADVGVGILFFLAITSITAYGLVAGGWASYSKYSVMGGLRSLAQSVSFEIPMGLALISVLMSTGTLNLNEMVIDQKGIFLGFLPNWLCFRQPLAFLIFLITAFAETNRLPFDMPEAEPELVGGYHTEYSGLKFTLFMSGEYIAMTTISGVMVTLFLGGWYMPGLEEAFTFLEITNQWIIGFVSISVFMGKLMVLLFLFIWVRWTLPRVRWDQLMTLGWKVLIPLSLINILLTALFSKLV